ncbi:MAG TPA: hypothetical protein IAA32_10275 [Candidatus Butyricicoccus stercorigallinarum]|nr:hypothetical protein [Candidatus Butyricicoccus stercorigallinarum]
MKKRMTALLLAAMLATLLLAGCGSTAGQTDAQDSSSASNSDVGGAAAGSAQTDDTQDDAQDDAAGNGAAAQDDTAPSGGTAQSTGGQDELSTLSQKVTDAVAAADAATPSGSRDADRTLFMEHKMALDSLDRELDAYEDALEAQYRSGQLSFDAFRTEDIEVERLEDNLDDAEDRLEDRFGMDD